MLTTISDALWSGRDENLEQYVSTSSAENGISNSQQTVLNQGL